MLFRSRFALSAVLLSAAMTALPAAVRADDPTITIATMPIDGGSEVIYAQELGYFKKAGLNVSVRTLPNGAAITAAVLSGAVDVGFTNIVSLATAYKKGFPVTLLAGAGTYDAAAPTMVCMTPQNSAIKTAKELDGKTVAINGIKSIVQFGIQDWIDKHGGDAKTVNFVEMPFPSIPPALAQGRFDAAVLTEPYVAEAKKGGHVLSNCFDSIASSYIISGYAATTAWVKAHPDLARKFDTVIAETAVWANHNQAQSGQMLARAAKLDPETVRTMVRSRYAERLDVAQVQPVIDVSAKYGALPAAFPASDLFYSSALR